MLHHHRCNADRQCALDHRKGYMMQPRIRPSLSPSVLFSLDLPFSPSYFLSLTLHRSLSSPFFCLSLSISSHSHRLCLYLFLHSPLQRRLKYLHDQIERYCAESLDYLWPNAGKISRGGGRNTRAVIAGIFRTRRSGIRDTGK